MFVMEDIGVGTVRRLATRNPVKDLLLGIGRVDSCEPLHLFLSTILAMHHSPSPIGGLQGDARDPPVVEVRPGAGLQRLLLYFIS